MESIIDNRFSEEPDGFVTKERYVADRLRAEITQGRLSPGERIRQGEVARWLGVSQAPVREALRLLEAEGLVQLDPHRGARVVSVTSRDAIEVAHIRVLLEGEAARLAAAHVTSELLAKLEALQAEMRTELDAGNGDRVRLLNRTFHMTLYRAAEQGHLVALISSVLDSFPWDQVPRVYQLMLHSIDEHEALLDALRAGDGDRLSQLVATHIEHWRDSVIQSFDEMQLNRSREEKSV